MAHKIFVYGSLKRGFGNSYVLDKSIFICTDNTFTAEWFMFSMGGFPGVAPGIGNYFFKVSGEVYEVDQSVMSRLDMLEGNGHFYTRQEVALESGEEAWMYVLPRVGHRKAYVDRVSIDEKTGLIQTWEH